MKPAILASTQVKSIAQAALDMLAQKDSTESDTGTTYAVGDSDKVEDMLFRYHVEMVNGEERLVLRFRLKEDVAEDVVARLVTSGSGQKGNWKSAGDKFGHDLEMGDLIAVRLGQYKGGKDPQYPNLQVLKPDISSAAPNATVISNGVLIGKTLGPDGKEFDTYRFTVRMVSGEIGEVDIQDREGAPLTTFVYDHNAPAPVSGTNLSLTPVAAQEGWTRVGPMELPGNFGQVEVNDKGVWIKNGNSKHTFASGSGGFHLVRQLDGAHVSFQGAHEVESGIGHGNTRKANLAGEVTVSLPLASGTPNEEEIKTAISRAMEMVGLDPESQSPPTNEQILNLALAKFVGSYHPTYKYRDKPISGVDDPRVIETLANMNKELKLDEPVTLDDLRIHTFKSGRMQVVLSPRVGKAIAKRQGIKFYGHRLSGSASNVVSANPHSGLMSTDERWTRGILTKGWSPWDADLRNGAGDRVYVHAHSSGSPDSGQIILNPALMGTSTEGYTMGVGDAFGNRSTTNMFLGKGGHYEYMFKRMIEVDFIGLVVTSNPDSHIAELKSKGITHINGIPIEDVIVTPAKAKAIVDSPEWYERGLNLLADDIPVTQLLAA